MNEQPTSSASFSDDWRNGRTSATCNRPKDPTHQVEEEEKNSPWKRKKNVIIINSRYPSSGIFKWNSRPIFSFSSYPGLFTFFCSLANRCGLPFDDAILLGQSSVMSSWNGLLAAVQKAPRLFRLQDVENFTASRLDMIIATADQNFPYRMKSTLDWIGPPPLTVAFIDATDGSPRHGRPSRNR